MGREVRYIYLDSLTCDFYFVFYGLGYNLHYVPYAMPVFPNVFARKTFLTARNNHGSSYRCSS
jgi:hypothetical protein